MQIIYFLILNFLLLAFLNSENAGEILLTNLANEMNPIQIPLTHKKNGSSSFGFHFKWVEGFCKPDGLLICYLSNLIIGGKMTKRFKIGRQKNVTSISEKCKEKIKLESKNGEIWNGILLEESSDLGRNFTMELALTGKKYYFDGNELTLELGVPTKLKNNGQNSKIDQINDEEKDLYTNFTEQMSHGAFFVDYLGIWSLGMDLIPSNGETLQIYVFRSCDCTMKAWFLPNIAQEKMPEWGQIDKRIECPEEKQKNFIELPKPLEKGKMLNISLKLAENAITQVVIRLFHKWTRETWSKYVGAIIDEKLEMYWAKVMHPIKNFQKYNYGDLLNITIKLKGQPLIELQNFDQKGSFNFDGIGNDGRFTFQILQNEHNLSIGLNGNWIVRGFWLHNWFYELGVNIVKLEQIQFLIAEPPATQFDAKNLSNYELVQVHKLAKEFKGNEIIILRAFMPKEIYETDGVNIEFLYNTNDEQIGNYFVGERIMYIFITIIEMEKIKVLTLEKQTLKLVKLDNPLQPGALFELRIYIPSRKFGENNDIMEKYAISTNFNHTIIDEAKADKTKFPLWKINRIAIQGVRLIEEPEIIYPSDEEKITDYSINIKQLNYENGKKGDLLVLGDQIIIEGKVPAGAQEFIINLCFHEDNCMIADLPAPFPAEDNHHPINKESKIGGIVLYIRIMFNSTKFEEGVNYHQNKFLMNNWYRYNDKKEGGDWQEETERKPHDLVPGERFTMKIVVEEMDFLVILNNQSATMELTECNPDGDFFITIRNKKCRLAPWSADHLQIFGDVEIPIEKIKRINTRKNKLELPYIKNLENGLEITENVSLFIKGNHNVTNLNNQEEIAFTIGIYHDGIGNFDWLREQYGIGEALLQFDFTFNGGVKISTSVKNSEGKLDRADSKRNFKNWSWRDEKQIVIQIDLVVISNIAEYEIRVNHQNTTILGMELPLWAGDYLYINTGLPNLFALTEEPKYIYKE